MNEIKHAKKIYKRGGSPNEFRELKQIDGEGAGGGGGDVTMISFLPSLISFLSLLYSSFSYPIPSLFHLSLSRCSTIKCVNSYTVVNFGILLCYLCSFKKKKKKKKQ
jgi:hypothetical protein